MQADHKQVGHVQKQTREDKRQHNQRVVFKI